MSVCFVEQTKELTGKIKAGIWTLNLICSFWIIILLTHKTLSRIMNLPIQRWTKASNKPLGLTVKQYIELVFQLRINLILYIIATFWSKFLKTLLKIQQNRIFFYIYTDINFRPFHNMLTSDWNENSINGLEENLINVIKEIFTAHIWLLWSMVV